MNNTSDIDELLKRYVYVERWDWFLDIYTDMLVMNLGSMVDPALFKELCNRCRVIQKDVPRWMICDYYKKEPKS